MVRGEGGAEELSERGRRWMTGFRKLTASCLAMAIIGALAWGGRLDELSAMSVLAALGAYVGANLKRGAP